MLFSIIIPEYNGSQHICRCLDSIYSQEINSTQFETIIVDDCSTETCVKDIIRNYCSQHSIKNLNLIEHSENKRQGGARNTGLDNAKGDFIIYLDCDDILMPGILSIIGKYLNENPNIDVLQIDHNLSDGTTITRASHYENNKTGIMSSTQFFRINEVSWTPWSYIASRDYIQKIGLRFIENKQFEDTDHSLKLVAYADKVAFLPVVLVSYIQTGNSTVNIGNDSIKLTSLFEQISRIGEIVRTLKNTNEELALLIRNHYEYAYDNFIKSYLWRLSLSKICFLIRKYPYKFESPKLMLSLFHSSPKCMSVIFSTSSLFIKLAYKIRKILFTNKFSII